MKNPVCPLCEHQNNKLCFSERDYKLFSCNVCDLFFIDPYPSNIVQVYNRVSKYDYQNYHNIIQPDKHYLGEVQYYKKYFALIEEECNNAKSILDVGCGTGHLLELMGKYPEILRIGIELNIDRADMAMKVSGCEIYQVPIEKFSFEQKFDVITMMNVLSHISSFNNLFTSVRGLLKKSGKLILKVSELEKDVQKNDVFDWEIPDHLHFLGLRTIEFICDKYGFNVLKSLRTNYSDYLFTVDRWKTPGRSALRNSIKQIIANVPFALPLLHKCYDIKHGRNVYSSFISLTPN